MRQKPISALEALLAAVFAALPACGGGGAPTYEDIAVEVRRSCSAPGACHGGEEGQAMLNFGAALESDRPVTEILNGVPSCEYDAMPRVSPGDPEGSWLMVKLDGAHSEAGDLLFEPDPSWESGLEPRPDGTLPPSDCPLTEDGELSFGNLMPLNPSVADPLPPAKVDMFREWIALGAPGPGTP